MMHQNKLVVLIFCGLILIGCKENNDHNSSLEGKPSQKALTPTSQPTDADSTGELPEIFDEWTTSNYDTLLLVIDNALYLKNRAGNADLIAESVIANSIDVSPDQRFVSYLSTNSEEETFLNTFDLNSREHYALLPMTEDLVWLRWSPDGQWISLISAKILDDINARSIGILPQVRSIPNLYLSSFDGSSVYELAKFPVAIAWSANSNLLVNTGQYGDINNDVPEKFLHIVPGVDDIQVENIEINLPLDLDERQGLYNPAYRQRTVDLLEPLNIELAPLDDSDLFSINEENTAYVELVKTQRNDGCLDFSIIHKPFSAPIIPDLVYQSKALTISDLNFQSNGNIIFAEQASISCDKDKSTTRLMVVNSDKEVSIIYENIVPMQGNQYVVSRDGQFILFPLYDDNGKAILTEYDFANNTYKPIASLNSHAIQAIRWLQSTN